MKTRYSIAAAVVAMFLVSEPVSAEFVSETRARSAAESFFKSPATRTGASVELVWDGTEPGTRASVSEAPFYIYNNSRGGFVMIAADTKSMPVLAWSDRGSFTVQDMPDNARYWFNLYAEYINSLRVSGNGTTAADQAWSKLEGGYVTAEGEGEEHLLETAQWNQDKYTGLYAPVKNSYCGCGPLAAAIVLRYHKWPDCGVDTVPGYSFGNFTKVKVEPHALGHFYNWDNMPMTLGESDLYDDTEDALCPAHEVSRLLYDLGTMFKAEYTTTGTSVATTMVERPLKTYMKVDKSSHLIDKDIMGYATDEWLSIIYSEIDADRPVFYYGATEDNSGHAFVADGYDADGRVHINFGWGGHGSAYYTFPEFDCDYNFNQGHGMIIGIKADEGGKEYEEVTMYELNDYYSLETKKKSIVEGELFYLKCTVYNLTSITINPEVAWVKVDKDGNIDEFIDEPYLMEDWESWTGYYMTSDSCIIETPIEEGDKLMFYYYTEGNGEWKPAREVDENQTHIDLYNPETLEQATSVSYDRESKILTVKTKYGASFLLETADGEEVSEGISSVKGHGKNTISIDLGTVAVGKYKLHLETTTEQKTLELTF